MMVGINEDIHLLLDRRQSRAMILHRGDMDRVIQEGVGGGILLKVVMHKAIQDEVVDGTEVLLKHIPLEGVINNGNPTLLLILGVPMQTFLRQGHLRQCHHQCQRRR